MKLNAEIIFDALERLFPIEMSGTADEALNLGRPEFLLGSDRNLLSGHLYIVREDRLPQRPSVERGAVVVCVGNTVHLPYYEARCTLIRIMERADIFAVFNTVQQIFNGFDAWDKMLHDFLDGKAKVKDMVKCSMEVFNNPIFVIDANFRFLAYEGYDAMPDTFIDKLGSPKDKENLSMTALSEFLKEMEPSMSSREPQLIRLLATTTLNVNLFNGEDYIGCLTIFYRSREFRKSDRPLAKYLAEMLTKALLKYSSALMSEKNLLRQILQDMVDGLPMSADQRRTLDSADHRRKYVCVKLELGKRFAPLPIGYVCNVLEDSFAKSIAFEHDSSVICFIETKALLDGDGAYAARLRERMEAFIHTMDVRIGVSDCFSDLYSARLYFAQASAALNNGALFDPKERYFQFQDYALMELVANALGDFPAELFYSDGLRRLVRHDLDASVSYIHTLRVYLEHNMSVTQTAAALYIHRSTLLERLARVERELGTDLKDPDERLQLLILLKSMQLHESISGKREA